MNHRGLRVSEDEDEETETETETDTEVLGALPAACHPLWRAQPSR